MKTTIKILCITLSLLMVLMFSSCGGNGSSSGNGGEVVMSYGDLTLNESEFMYIASYIKDSVVYNQQNYIYQLTGTVYEEADILSMPVDENNTVADYIKDYAIELSQQLLIIETLCNQAGVTITDQTDLDDISNYIADVEYAYGGEDLFEIALARLGFTRSGLERFEKFSKLYELYNEYRYGENGVAKVPQETVNKYFEENYIHYDGCIYSYVDTENGEYLKFEYTDEDISDYFYSDFVKVQHVLYLTVDSSGAKLSDAKIAEKKKKAEDAFAAIESGEKTLEDYKSETEDSGYEYTFTYGEMVEAFEKASFEMEVGEVRCVETEYGFHIVQKVEMTDEDLNGVTDEEGKTKGGMKDAVVVAMTKSKIRGEALALLEKLNNGETDKFPEENEQIPYYIYQKSAFIDKNNSSSKSFIDLVSKLEDGKTGEQDSATEGTYLIRRLAFSAKDITADIYNTIESNLSITAYSEYVQSFYDSVEINNDIISKFDILTLPALEEEFYQ